MAKSIGPACGSNPNFKMSDGDRKVVDDFQARLALQAAAGPYIEGAVWVDGDPLMEVIAATVWERCGRDDEDMPQLVCDDPRTIAAFAAAVARAHADAAPCVSAVDRQFLTFALDLAADQMASRGSEFDADDEAAMQRLLRMADEAQSGRSDVGPSARAGLRDEIAAALEAADYRMDMRRGDLADAVMPVLYRAWPWLRAEAEDAAAVGARQPDTQTTCERCGHTRQAHNISGCTACPGGWRADHRFTSVDEPPADPWSVEYHRMGAARLNPAVCTCGLGPDAIVHNEPPHAFNGRPKPGMPGVYGICTDCHHHETAACHAASSAVPGRSAATDTHEETQA